MSKKKNNRKKILNELKTIIDSLEILYNDIENNNLTSNKKKKHKKKKHKKNSKSYYSYDDSFDSFSEDIGDFDLVEDLFDDIDFEDNKKQ